MECNCEEYPHILMLSPGSVWIRFKDGERIDAPAPGQEKTIHIADHWYLLKRPEKV